MMPILQSTRTVQGTFLPPRNAEDQFAQAAQSLSEKNAAGKKALAEACGTEFKADDAISAAAVIRRLRVMLDAAKKETTDQANLHATQANHAIAQAKAELNATIGNLREELSRAYTARDTFNAGVRATMIDRAFTEIPGMVGYFTGETPLQIAAEAGAIYTAKYKSAIDQNDIQGAYLRRRGWRMAVGNTWIAAGKTGSLPMGAALIEQVRADTAPFVCFAKRDWHGVPKPAVKAPIAEITESTPLTSEERIMKDALVETTSNPLEPILLVPGKPDDPKPVAETTQIAMTKPVITAFSRSDEEFNIPPLR